MLLPFYSAFWAQLQFSSGQFFCLFFTKANTRNILWSKIDLIIRQVSNFKFNERAIKPQFYATSFFFFPGITVK